MLIGYEKRGQGSFFVINLSFLGKKPIIYPGLLYKLIIPCFEEIKGKGFQSKVRRHRNLAVFNILLSFIRYFYYIYNLLYIQGRVYIYGIQRGEKKTTPFFI